MQSEGKAVIGLECHVQLHTASKLFCGCTTKATEPNSATCEICLGMPGSKPSLNEKALEFGLRVALALNCEINREFFFSRKTYFYPDLAKNFQITQFEIPLAKNGFVKLRSGKTVVIRRVHLEEDPAALVHEGGMASANYSLVDYNRSGIPLVEIVTEPVIDSPAEAREFLDELLNILNYLGVFVQGEDTLKVDSNISIKGSERVEVKNISGFQAVEKALLFEIERQRKALGKGGKVEREVRSFDEATGSTRSLRKKEFEEDYGYIFEPDLPSIELSEKQISDVKNALPELPQEKAQRLEKQFGLPAYDAKVLSSDISLAGLFDETAKTIDPKLSAKFLTRELLAILNHGNLSLSQLRLEANEITALLELLEKGMVSEKNAKEAMIKYVNEKIPPKEFLQKNNLLKDMKSDETAAIVEKVLNENPQAVEDLKKGETKALNFLVGLVMRQTKGKAEAREVQRMIEEMMKNAD
ncbi:MAG: Asp-tRNA(Asn)/Glu-tRNA(Gln) amidotransferase subunit GatB [Candidatus Diapherotrites archaeon]